MPTPTQRGSITDAEIDTLSAEELRSAIKAFRTRNPEVKWYVKWKRAGVGTALVAAFLGGDQLDPTLRYAMWRESRLEQPVTPPVVSFDAIEANHSDLKLWISDIYLTKGDFNRYKEDEGKLLDREMSNLQRQIDTVREALRGAHLYPQRK